MANCELVDHDPPKQAKFILVHPNGHGARVNACPWCLGYMIHLWGGLRKIAFKRIKGEETTQADWDIVSLGLRVKSSESEKIEPHPTPFKRVTA
jgi:hypothetical protein